MLARYECSRVSIVRRTALVALVLAYVHTVFGAVVRISGSAMGCGDNWPDCNGSLLPALTNRTLVIEVTHRYSAVALLGVPIFALVLVAIAHWRTPGIRGRGGVLRAALLAAALVIVAALVGMALVVHGLTGGPAVALHYVIALATLAALTLAAQRAGGLGASDVEFDGLAPAKTYRGALAAAIMVFITVVFGSLTANIPGAAQSCQGFPWCREGMVSTGSVLFVQLAHRVLAFLVALHLLGFTIGSARRLAAKTNSACRPARPSRRRAATRGGCGARGAPPASRPPIASPGSGHAAVGDHRVASRAGEARAHDPDRLCRTLGPERRRDCRRGRMTAQMPQVPAPGAIDRRSGIVRDLVALTKPRIISLLLLTTVAPMFLAGTPSAQLVLLVVAGGYLMAGGANAVNMYFDRDIDSRMARTRLRPIPSGRMAPLTALVFGVALAAAGTALLARFVNVLTASLALGGFYFYILVYTRWLKRSTPHNIVIGGAAGAFPPLVGWAAVTGRIDLMAVYLFLIVFYWTPPHFWALALLKQRDYGRAGIPMAPLVWGDVRTIDQMMYYTIILIALTLLPVAFGALGMVYGAAALALDAVLLAGVIRVRRAATRSAPGSAAWAVYKFSLLYLALLFVAMVIDRRVST